MKQEVVPTKANLQPTRETIETSTVFHTTVKGQPAPYSPALKITGIGGLIVVSGQVAIDENGEVVGHGDIAAQAHQALDNLRNLLETAGARMDDIVKLTCWLTRAEYLEAYVEVRRGYFSSEGVPPASSTVVSSLVGIDLLIEVDAIAVI